MGDIACAVRGIDAGGIAGLSGWEGSPLGQGYPWQTAYMQYSSSGGCELLQHELSAVQAYKGRPICGMPSGNRSQAAALVSLWH